MRSRVLGGIGVLAVLLVGFVLAIPYLFGGRIERVIRRQANASVNAKVQIGDIGLSLFQQFPLLEVRVDDVAIRGEPPYQGVELLTFESLTLGLDLYSVVAGPAIEVRRIDWVEPAIDIRIAEDGTSNLDIFPESDEAEAPTDEPAGDYAVVLESLTITGLDIEYTDASLGLSTQLRELGTALTGRFDATTATVAAQAEAAAWSFEERGVTLVRDAGLAANLDLDYALDSGAVTLRDNEVRINELALSFAGSVTPVGADTDLDLTFASKQSSFKALLSMVPAAYIEGYEAVKADGTFSLAGTAKGRLPAEGDDLPGFTMDLSVDGGTVQYPDLPSAVRGIALKMAVAHPQGPLDGMTVDVPRFAFEVAGAPLSGSLKLANPMTDPRVALSTKGTLNFVKLAAAMPSGGLPPEGIVKLDLDVEGKASDFEAQRVDAVRASGEISARKIVITDTGYATPVRIQRMQAQFDPKVVTVPELVMSWLGSDLSVTAQLDNVVPYLVGTHPLHGRAALTAKVLDLRPFQGETAEAESDTEESGNGVVVVVPDDLDLAMTADFGKVITTDFQLSDMVGTLSVADQSVTIDELTASMLGGRVGITGRYTARTPDYADIDFRIETIAFDLPQTVGEFETLGQVAPLLKGVQGKFDSSFQLAAGIDEDGNPDLGALTSQGSLLAQGLTFTPVSLNSAASQLKQPSLATVEIAQKALKFKVEEGQLTFEPFAAKFGGLPAQVSGGAGIVDETVDLAVDLGVPAKGLVGSSLLKGASGIGDTVGVRLGITGPYDDPKVQIGLADGSSVADAVVDSALDKVGLGNEDRVAKAREQGDKLVAEAEARAAQIRATAKTQADKLRKEGRQAANKLEKEAGNNPIKKVAAEKAADATRKQANKSADKIEKEADAQADKLVAEAKSQRDKLVRDAQGG